MSFFGAHFARVQWHNLEHFNPPCCSGTAAYNVVLFIRVS